MSASEEELEFSHVNSVDSIEKIHCLTSEFHGKFHAKNRHRTNRKVMSAILVFQVA